MNETLTEKEQREKKTRKKEKLCNEIIEVTQKNNLTIDQTISCLQWVTERYRRSALKLLDDMSIQELALKKINPSPASPAGGV